MVRGLSRALFSWLILGVMPGSLPTSIKSVGAVCSVLTAEFSDKICWLIWRRSRACSKAAWPSLSVLSKLETGGLPSTELGGYAPLPASKELLRPNEDRSNDESLELESLELSLSSSSSSSSSPVNGGMPLRTLRVNVLAELPEARLAEVSGEPVLWGCPDWPARGVLSSADKMVPISLSCSLSANTSSSRCTRAIGSMALW